MTPKFIFVLLLALFGTSVAQSDTEIPEETDNQFPPVIHSELDLAPIEGSGDEEPPGTTTDNVEVPFIENVQLSSTLVNNDNIITTDNHTCPTKCICNIEGDSDKYVVDCSDAELTELPKSLDPKTTDLKLQNNKLTAIPKDISDLKNLRVLNISNNQLMEIAAGSISELPELMTLDLGNNRLIDYPKDLKNSFGLTKLQELILGGNDMRSDIKSETFSIFKALKDLTLPSSTPELLDELCAALHESLVTVCTETCTVNSYDCPDAPDAIDDLDVVLPAMISADLDYNDTDDLIDSTKANTDSDINNKTENEGVSTTTPDISNVETTTPIAILKSEGTIDGGASFHSAVIQAVGEDLKPIEVGTNEGKEEPKPVEEDQKPTVFLSRAAPQAKPTATGTNPTAVETNPTEVERENKNEEQAAPNSNIISNSDGKVAGSTTASAKSGGVDKSIIGIIVAGMVLVVAGITIKKNWSSIRNRFSSTPRNANDRTGINANGTAPAPEEVPLQEKSPV